MKVALISLGCPKNQADSEIMLGLMAQNGFTLTEELDEAQIIIINTCGFIQDAKQESIDTILQMSLYKKRGKCRLLVVAGCLSQRYGDQLLKGIPEIDVVLGTTSFPEIVGAVRRCLEGKRELNLKDADVEIMEGLPRVPIAPPYTAYIKIADGCDNRCSYCIIPRLRGRYRSRKEEEIFKETGLLASRGVKEIILIAQDTTKYGKDIYREYRLPQLLERLSRIQGIEWIRLLYCYPDGVSDELIDVLKSNKNVCSYIDMPIQHISNRVLKRMNRNTTGEEIEGRIKTMKKQIPWLVLRSTLIAGFPGETEEDFEEMLAFVKKGYFDRLGVFTYSKEEDTPAYRIKNQVPAETAIERKNIIMEAQRRISLSKNALKVGKVFKVLLEGRDGDMYYGRTYGDAPEIDNRVLFLSDRPLTPGEFVKVKIQHAFEYDLIGRVL